MIDLLCDETRVESYSLPRRFVSRFFTAITITQQADDIPLSAFCVFKLPLVDPADSVVQVRIPGEGLTARPDRPVAGADT